MNRFPNGFAHEVGKRIIYLLATKPEPSLEGPEWEKIFADSIGGQWKPTNIGLDDIVKETCAWGAKSVIDRHPFTVMTIRLISGRNNPEYSFGTIAGTDDGIGQQVLEIWNARVDEIRRRYAHARTVVLLKGSGWSEFAVFETETVRYPPDLYEWDRNRRGNLEGREKATGNHRFTWQRHGSQFTIIENIPPSRLKFRIRVPPVPDMEATLARIAFDEKWVQVVR